MILWKRWMMMWNKFTFVCFDSEKYDLKKMFVASKNVLCQWLNWLDCFTHGAYHNTSVMFAKSKLQTELKTNATNMCKKIKTWTLVFWNLYHSTANRAVTKNLRAKIERITNSFIHIQTLLNARSTGKTKFRKYSLLILFEYKIGKTSKLVLIYIAVYY